MVRTVCLNEDKHSVTMLRSVKQMKHEDDFCDFTIRVKNNEFQTHRVIIAAGSPYFKAMLKHDTKENQEGNVEMKDVDAECVKSCIDFLYSGKFDLPDGKTAKLLHVAIMMQLENVKEAICNILDEELNAENFYQTRNIAEMYQLSTIVTKCKAYYEENFMAISSQPGFEIEKKSHLAKIFKSKKLKLSEEDKLAVSLKWVGNNPEKNKELLELIKHIKLKEISLSYLSDVLRNHSIISNDFRLYKLMNDPLVGHAEKSRNGNNSQADKLLIFFDRDADRFRSYNQTTDEVAKFSDVKFKHLMHFAMVSTGAYIYVLCGNKSVHRLTVADKIWKWERMQDIIADHGIYPPSTSFYGSLLVIASDVDPTKDVEKFDPAVNKWLRLKDKPVAVCMPTLVSLGDSIYCIGGHNGCRDLNALCKFTPSTLEWVDREPMKTARYDCGAVAVEQQIFVMGGQSESGKLNDVECYDVTSGQWTPLSPMIEVHRDIVAHHIDGWIFCVSREASSNEVEKYDIGKARWSKVKLKGIPSFTVYDCSSIRL